VVDWAGRTTTYSWDSAGRLTGITRPNGVTRANQYDNANRLERIYERDSAGRLLVYFKYGHDDDGRITSRYRLPQPQSFTVPASAASYDADNRLELWNSQSVIHDADGNMTSGPLGAAGFVSYNYDARNRLNSVGTAGSGFTYYAYDSENNRVSVTNPAGVTQYLVDPHGDALPRVLVREKPDASTTTYVYGIGLLYEVNDATGDVSYYHFDNIGNTAALTGPTGTITDRIEYTPYGQIAYRSGTTDTPFLYVGQLGVMQEANGLIYMRARFYSHQTQRFLNADPIGFAGGMNWYAYANGNPVMFVDPDGLNPYALTGIGGGYLPQSQAGLEAYARMSSYQNSPRYGIDQAATGVNGMINAVNSAATYANAVGDSFSGKAGLALGLKADVYAGPLEAKVGVKIGGYTGTYYSDGSPSELTFGAAADLYGKAGPVSLGGRASTEFGINDRQQVIDRTSSSLGLKYSSYSLSQSSLGATATLGFVEIGFKSDFGKIINPQTNVQLLAPWNPYSGGNGGGRK
jgi:RHS repeat-associated protein